MPGAVVNEYSCFGICRWNNSVDSRYLGGNNSYLIRFHDGYKYPNGSGGSYIPNFTIATMS
jgi:hypothetical protein